MKTFLWLLIAFFAFAGCIDHNGVDNRLSAVESLIANNPDSALRILAGVDTTELSDLQKNRVGLLLAYACVIHAIPVSLDSADIKSGDEAFIGSFTPDEVKWLVVKSAVAKNAGDPVSRIENLKDAEFIASQFEPEFDLAMIYQYLADVYKQGFNGTLSRYYADRSVRLLGALDCPKQLREARMAVAGALGTGHDYVGMRDSLLALKDEVMSAAGYGYRIFFLDQLARAYDETGESEKAIAIWRSAFEDNAAGSNTLAHWAAAYMRSGNLDSAYLLIGRAISLPHNSSDEYLCRNVEYGILEAMGRTGLLPEIDSLRNVAADRISRERRLEESSLAFNRKYDSETKRAWLDAARSRHRSAMSLMLAAIVVVIAAAVFLYFSKRNRMLKLEHENDLLRIRVMQDSLFERDVRNKELSAKISELFKSRFEVIDNLAASYFECKETVMEQKHIYLKVRDSIAGLSSDASVRQLESLVDSYNDGLMMKFRNDYPKLSPSARRLALYLFCGFSLQSVSIFTGTDLRNRYVYKSRLKMAVTRSDCPRKGEYLSYFH